MTPSEATHFKVQREQQLISYLQKDTVLHCTHSPTMTAPLIFKWSNNLTNTSLEQMGTEHSPGRILAGGITDKTGNICGENCYTGVKSNFWLPRKAIKHLGLELIVICSWHQSIVVGALCYKLLLSDQNILTERKCTSDQRANSATV